jgi:hypothetical protein
MLRRPQLYGDSVVAVTLRVMVCHANHDGDFVVAITLRLMLSREKNDGYFDSRR